MRNFNGLEGYAVEVVMNGRATAPPVSAPRIGVVTLVKPSELKYEFSVVSMICRRRRRSRFDLFKRRSSCGKRARVFSSDTEVGRVCRLGLRSLGRSEAERESSPEFVLEGKPRNAAGWLALCTATMNRCKAYSRNRRQPLFCEMTVHLHLSTHDLSESNQD